MQVAIEILYMFAQAINMLVVIWVVLGLLFAFNVVSSRNAFLYQVERSISALFEPILSPIRRIMPQTGAIDFSPMVFLLLLWSFMKLLDYAAKTV